MSTGLVGRHEALESVTRFLGWVTAGPAMLVLDGEPGIGKTALWRAAVTQAEQNGCRVLTCQPSAAEAQLSYSSLADLLADVDDSALDSLPAPQRQAIDRVLLRADAQAAPTDRRATGAALHSVLERLSDAAPVLLAVDDLQWADRSSVQAIEFAVRRLSTPVGVLATLRTDGDQDPLRSLRTREPDRAQHLRVGPLSLGALHAMLQERTGRSFPRPTMMRILRVSGGNPFYALELARVIGADGMADPTMPLPGSLAQLVEARIVNLDAAVKRVLLAAAALAEPTVELVQLAVDADALEIEHLLEVAELGGLIRIDGNRVRFTHPLLATGVLAAASPAARRAMHRQLAKIVGDSEECAQHLALACVRADQATVAALDTAATRARDRGAPAVAAEFLELAVRLGGDTPERRIRLGQHHFDAGDPVRARSMLEGAVAALAPGPPRAEALRLLATVRLHNDSYPEAASYLEQALEEAGTEVRLRLRISIDLLYVLVNLGRIPDALRLTAGVVADSEQVGDPHLQALALASSAMVRFLSGEGLDEPTLQRALELEQPDVPTPAMLRPSLISGLLLVWTGRLDEGRDQLLDVRRHCIDRGEESDLMFGAFHTVIVECWRGDFAGAGLIAEDTMERALQLGTDIPFAIAQCGQAMVHAYAGRSDEARQAAREALAIFERGSSLAVTVWPIVTLGFVELSVGDQDAAAEILGPLAAAALAMGYGEPAAAPFAPDAAEALIGVGRLEEAAQLIDQLEANGRRLDRPWALALGARCRSLLLAAGGDLDAAAAAAERALAEHERLPMPFERARTQLVLGQVQRRRRQKRAAAAAIDEAVRIFDELGTPLWAARARAELERVNVGPVGPTDLTPSERRVAELAATGMTNREVAQAMFIHPKTVEANLSRAYRKLGIHSRAELGQWMSRSSKA